MSRERAFQKEGAAAAAVRLSLENDSLMFSRQNGQRPRVGLTGQGSPILWPNTVDLVPCRL